MVVSRYRHHRLLLVDCRQYCKDASFDVAAVVPCRPSLIANCEPTCRSAGEMSFCRVVHDDAMHRQADIRSVSSKRPLALCSYRHDDDGTACFASSVGYFRRIPTVAMPFSQRQQLPPLGTNHHHHQCNLFHQRHQIAMPRQRRHLRRRRHPMKINDNVLTFTNLHLQ